MEKKTPHYDLNLVKDDIRKGNYRITQTSFMHALSDFGLKTKGAICNEILNLSHSDFYKSMTSHANHKIWHDVYKKKMENGKAYFKIQIVADETVIISFKKE